jgi:hypothetical protein
LRKIISKKLGKVNTFKHENMLCSLALLHVHKDRVLAGLSRENILGMYVGKLVNDSLI